MCEKYEPENHGDSDNDCPLDCCDAFAAQSELTENGSDYGICSHGNNANNCDACCFEGLPTVVFATNPARWGNHPRSE